MRLRKKREQLKNQQKKNQQKKEKPPHKLLKKV